mmetsp:Transcript_48287/g.115042  ORF Transcript_48287/g.115042 Transcript_48287/m.115042 type:complete len:407 (+) Transcript_48287:78-1298(+)
MRLLGFLLLAHRALADVAFLAPSAPTARAPSGLIPSVIRDAELPVPPKQAASTGMSTALLLGASAVALALARRRANLSRRVWTYQPIEEKICPGLGKEAASGPLWRQYMNLRRQSKSPYGRKVKYLKQQRILRDHNVWWATYGKWNVWNPNPGIKSNYTGPDSHPDNPDFPAPNSGLQAFGSVSVASLSTRSSFVAGRVPTMGSAKRAVLSASRARSGLVMKAHKKAAASTKNQGNTRNPHHWGVKALSGKAVKCRQRLVKQRAMNWYPGNNVKMCKDMSLIALKDGIVQWRGDYRHKEVSVVPWEYVTNKCRWSTSSTLAPQKYEPWMGTNFDRYSDKWPIRQMFEEWKETEEGKAWIAKKEEKKAKQKEIQKKIRAKKALRWQGKGKKQDKVTAGDSDSEAEKA